MGSVGLELILVGEVILFFFLAYLCLSGVLSRRWPVQQSAAGSYREIGEETGSAGVGTTGGIMRNWIQASLSLACVLRALALIRIILAKDYMSSYLVIPDLGFLGTYSMVALFMAQLHFVYVGRSQGKLTPIFLSAVASVLAVSFVMCLMRWRVSGAESAEAGALSSMLYYVVAVTYFSVLVPLAYFGAQTSRAAHRSQAIFFQLVVLIVTSSLCLLIKVVFFAMAATAASNSMRPYALSHSSEGRLQFEALFALDELLPALAIYLLTRGSKPQPPPASLESQGLAGQGGKHWSIIHPTGSSPGFLQIHASTGSYGSASSSTLH